MFNFYFWFVRFGLTTSRKLTSLKVKTHKQANELSQKLADARGGRSYSPKKYRRRNKLVWRWKSSMLLRLEIVLSSTKSCCFSRLTFMPKRSVSQKCYNDIGAFRLSRIPTYVFTTGSDILRDIRLKRIENKQRKLLFCQPALHLCSAVLSREN